MGGTAEVAGRSLEETREEATKLKCCRKVPQNQFLAHSLLFHLKSSHNTRSTQRKPNKQQHYMREKMAERGVNGASSATLNARFIKCAGCKVNVPKDDMIALGKCTVCGRAYEPVVLDGGNAIEVEFVAFSEETKGDANASGAAGSQPASAAAVEATAPLRRKRWVALQSRKGRTYYHNTETGEDRWDKPADIDAEAADDAFVPFKNDFVKKAVMLEQAKMEATKLGVPIALVTAAHQGQTQAEDPLSKMTKQALAKAEGAESAKKNTAAAAAAASSAKAMSAVQEEEGEGEVEYEEEFDEDDGRAQQGERQNPEGKDKCIVM